ncbi:MAG: FAD:protein FMN transferase [Actinomycetota bacterium]
MHALTFRAMGTTVSVLAPDPASAERARTAVRARCEAEEARFSRFSGSSELSHVNRDAGVPTRVSPTFASVVAEALRAARSTEGAFDPTVHDAVLAAGYDRDFDEVLAGARGTLHPARPCGRWTDVRLHGDVLHLPRGVHLDLGGIAKGWTADRAAEDAIGDGVRWVLVNAGGDLRVAGEAPALDVAVEDPWAPDRELTRLRLRSGALATSSTLRRAWGQGQHHVIDPRTGAPSRSPLVQATVWAPTCAEAEVRATACLIAGAADGHRPSVIVHATGDVQVAARTEEAA